MKQFTPRVASPTIKVADIAHLRYTRRDLARAERYFLDFGLRLAARTERAIYLRGVLPQHHCLIVEAGSHDRFVALGLRAASSGDLRTLASVHSAKVESRDEPGAQADAASAAGAEISGQRLRRCRASGHSTSSLAT